jgi:hypothetical protein
VVSEPLRLAYAQFYRARHIMLISSALISVMFIIAIWSTTRTLIGKAREHAEMREKLHHQAKNGDGPKMGTLYYNFRRSHRGQRPASGGRHPE